MHNVSWHDIVYQQAYVQQHRIILIDRPTVLLLSSSYLHPSDPSASPCSSLLLSSSSHSSPPPSPSSLPLLSLQGIYTRARGKRGNNTHMRVGEREWSGNSDMMNQEQVIRIMIVQFIASLIQIHSHCAPICICIVLLSSFFLSLSVSRSRSSSLSQFLPPFEFTHPSVEPSWVVVPLLVTMHYSDYQMMVTRSKQTREI